MQVILDRDIQGWLGADETRRVEFKRSWAERRWSREASRQVFAMKAYEVF